MNRKFLTSVSPEYCYDLDTLPKGAACPLCGATEKGDDSVKGICQARYARPEPKPYIKVVLQYKG